jgi:putative ubiquitin-RnfH superfamily antitoxin RatB of RatAB toxin-antitoxin module
MKLLSRLRQLGGAAETTTESADAASEILHVEVVYALPRFAELIKLDMPPGASVRDAIIASGLLERYPELKLSDEQKVGLHAKVVKLDQVLRDRDRVELYRPLIADPKAVRKKRADEGKQAKARDKKAVVEEQV